MILVQIWHDLACLVGPPSPVVRGGAASGDLLPPKSDVLRPGRLFFSIPEPVGVISIPESVQTDL